MVDYVGAHKNNDISCFYCYRFNIQDEFHLSSKCQTLVRAHRHAHVANICEVNGSYIKGDLSAFALYLEGQIQTHRNTPYL